MTHEEAVNTLLTEFDAVWADRTPVAHANVDFEPDENSAWARVTIIHSSASQVSLGSVGSRTFRRFGTVIVQVSEEIWPRLFVASMTAMNSPGLSNTRM